jgi:glycosyltransferase involved in cell wall biosynthesis
MGPSTMPATSGIQDQVTREELFNEAVNLLYICDFPPSNFSGGPVLMSRLLRGYPPDRIVVLTSSRYLSVSPKEGRLACPHIAFLTTNGCGRWGLGRIKNAIDWLMIPVLALVTAYLIRKRRIDVMMTIVHGDFFIAAAIAGWITRTPYIAVAHDDRVTPIQRRSPLLKYVLRPLVRGVLRGAAHIYAISPEMQSRLKSEYGVDSELQRPATEADCPDDTAAKRAPSFHSPVILYAGAITESVEDSLKLLAEILVTGKLQQCGLESARLYLYTQLSPEKIRDWGWDHPSISVQGWVPQKELRGVLRGADILFLPFSFSEKARYAVESAFPSKTADYLAAGRPILVFGPPYSSLVRYAAEQGFAEIVDEFSPDALVRGIQKIITCHEYRHSMIARSLEVFSHHHDVVQQRNRLRSTLAEVVRSHEGPKLSKGGSTS